MIYLLWGAIPGLLALALIGIGVLGSEMERAERREDA